MTALPPLEPLEEATGFVLGERRATPFVRLADQEPGSPREVLDAALLRAVSRPPCLVAFSGGRDSSSMLAAATDVARRHGLDDPVPITLRYPDHPRTNEDEWQEIVIRHLGLREWIKVPLRTEADIAGPWATALLRRHGLFWPSNATNMVPLAEHARGGSLVTGNGGDEMLTPFQNRTLVLAGRGRMRPTAYELKHLAVLALPKKAREAVWRRRRPVRLPWLTEEGMRQLAAFVAPHWATFTRTWHDQLEFVQNSRFRELSVAIFEAATAERDVLLVEPFFDPRFAASVLVNGPSMGFTDRAAALAQLFGHLLPRETVERSTKAVFTEVFFGPDAEAFASAWDGSGLDEEIIDVKVLREMWHRPRRDMRTFTPLQAAWLATRGAQEPAAAASIEATAS